MYKPFRIIMAAAIGVAALTSAAHAENAAAVSGGSTEPAMESCNPLLDDADDLERVELETTASIKIDTADRTQRHLSATGSR
jgi:hypothetical protein